MIHVDHSPGNPPTIAEPEADYTRTKLARDLVHGDVVSVNYRGYGNRIMRVDLRTFVAEDDNQVRLDLSTKEPRSHHVEFIDADATLVLYRTDQIGDWR